MFDPTRAAQLVAMLRKARDVTGPHRGSPLAEVASQLEAACAEVERMRPIVEAAKALRNEWRDTSGSMSNVDAIHDACSGVANAIDAALTAGGGK